MAPQKTKNENTVRNSQENLLAKKTNLKKITRAHKPKNKSADNYQKAYMEMEDDWSRE
jgi:hypothetical protein